MDASADKEKTNRKLLKKVFERIKESKWKKYLFVNQINLKHKSCLMHQTSF